MYSLEKNFLGGKHMLFSEVIREAGLSTQDYPNASLIPVVLYDGKNRKVNSQSVRFVNPLFCHNAMAKSRFAKCVSALDETPFETGSLFVRIDENRVILNYKTPKPQVFSRKPALDPLDYMD